MSIDIDYASPRGISVRESLQRLLDNAARIKTGCLIGSRGPDCYHEVKASGVRIGAHVAVVLVRGDTIAGGQVVRHTCDTPGCMETSHLIVGTQSQNVVDAYERDRRVDGWLAGEDRPNATMTASDVADMRRAHRDGEALADVIARFGFGYSASRAAIRGETWQHITEEAPVPGRRNQVGNPRALRLTHAEQARRALELHQTGKSLADVARDLSVSRHSAFRLVQTGRELVTT